jgi:hypothetical protein
MGTVDMIGLGLYHIGCRLAQEGTTTFSITVEIQVTMELFYT